jgi:signal peptidase II
MIGRIPKLVWLAVGLVVLDQITKALVHATLGLYDSRTIIPNLLNLVHVRNEGVAFGLFNAIDLPYKSVLMTGLACLALAAMGYYATLMQPHERLARLGLACILAGAVGNLIDRVRQGYVLDFVDFYWGTWHFWAFNVADASITVGAIFVFADLLLVNRHVPDPVSHR